MDTRKATDLTNVMAEALVSDLLRERRFERRWRWVTRTLFIGGSLALSLLYFFLWAPQLGWRVGPIGDVVGVVRIDGEITQASHASAERVVPALRRAFESPRVKAVVLAIDSPGGSPGEAERIYRALDNLRAEHGKPTVAVIGNVGASAAYLIALHTDRVYAGRYSLVGSIGAILASWDLHRAADRLEISQRMYASGPLKTMLSPFQPTTPEADTKARTLTHDLGQAFVTEVRRLRGKRLAEETDIASGEVWLGLGAHELGLIDGFGSLEEVVRNSWRLDGYDFGPSRNRGVLLVESAREILGAALSRFLSYSYIELR